MRDIRCGGHLGINLPKTLTEYRTIWQGYTGERTANEAGVETLDSEVTRGSRSSDEKAG